MATGSSLFSLIAAFFSSLLLFCCPLSACEWPTLTFLVGVDKPPYIRVDDKTGFELELLQQVSERIERCASFIHTPNGRLLELYQQGVADIVTLQQAKPEGLYASAPYISYENIVITRADLRPPVHSLEDLRGRRVIAFQNAHLFLAEPYARLIPAFASYLEVVEQQALPTLLQKNRVDALVMDINIFNYYQRQLPVPPVALLQLAMFGKNRYHLLGRDKALMQRFNQALLAFLQSPAYRELQLKYFHQLSQ